MPAKKTPPRDAFARLLGDEPTNGAAALTIEAQPPAPASNGASEDASMSASPQVKKLVTAGYRMDPDLLYRLKVVAAQQRRPAQDIVAGLISEYLDRVGG